MNYKICGFCRFWYSDKNEVDASGAQGDVEAGGTKGADGASPDRRSKIGACRKLPPRPSGSVALAEWPQTRQRDWCGEWEGRDVEYRNQLEKV